MAGLLREVFVLHRDDDDDGMIGDARDKQIKDNGNND
jgi:hypothetical protein